MVVSFFGHKNTQSTVKPLLKQTVQRLINADEEITFLVGTHGAFDLMIQSVLKEEIKHHPKISCYIVLSYLPLNNNTHFELPTLYPEGIECVPKRFAISSSNNYMVKECDTVVCYISHDWGGAAQFVRKAQKMDKTIINLSEVYKI